MRRGCSSCARMRPSRCEDRGIRDLVSLLAARRRARPERYARHSLAPARPALSRRGLRPASRSCCTSARASDRWLAFARPAKKLALGETVVFDSAARQQRLRARPPAAEVVAKGEGGEVELQLQPDRRLSRRGDRAARRIAAAALYRRQAPDRPAPTPPTTRRVYAREDGAVAAPTAGLHFTPELFAALDARGVSRHFVTLHVGAGTFLPVKAEDTDEHRMHAEWGTVSAETAAALNAVQGRGRADRLRRHDLAAADRERGRRGRHRSGPSRATPRSSSRRAIASAPSTC